MSTQVDSKLCPQCGEGVRRDGLGRPRRFCCDECRRRWNGDTSILPNELLWRRSLAPSKHNLSEAARLSALIVARGSRVPDAGPWLVVR
jgi:endogenous inhibitor of DNA gyrase (YacG/DUF329 family)